MSELTQERLKKVLKIVDGKFYNSSSRGRAKAGCRAGTLTQYGYWQICVDGSAYLEHRLVWLHEHGAFPCLELDHIDRDKLNNSIDNLREVTGSQNHANTNKRVGCTSKHKGVSWNKFRNKWKASIEYQGKSKHIGLFREEVDAHKAYCKEARELFGEYHHAGR